MARKGREWAARRLTEPPGRVPLVRWEPPKGTWGHPWAPGLLAVDRVPRRVCGQSWGGRLAGRRAGLDGWGWEPGRLRAPWPPTSRGSVPCASPRLGFQTLLKLLLG